MRSFVTRSFQLSFLCCGVGRCKLRFVKEHRLRTCGHFPTSDRESKLMYPALPLTRKMYLVSTSSYVLIHILIPSIGTKKCCTSDFGKCYITIVNVGGWKYIS